MQEQEVLELDLDLDVERSVRGSREPTPSERLAHLMPGKATVTERVNWGIDTQLRNQVQLSVYPDCFGPEGKRDIPAVAEFVGKNLGEAVGGVHVLPFYPSSADRGFAPLTHKEVNEELGTWEDLQGIAKERDLCVDYMVNHISAQSKEFKDFVSKGDEVRPLSREHPLYTSRSSVHVRVRLSSPPRADAFKLSGAASIHEPQHMVAKTDTAVRPASPRKQKCLHTLHAIHAAAAPCPEPLRHWSCHGVEF